MNKRPNRIDRLWGLNPWTMFSVKDWMMYYTKKDECKKKIFMWLTSDNILEVSEGLITKRVFLEEL